jgi:hypothetical protein
MASSSVNLRRKTRTVPVDPVFRKGVPTVVVPRVAINTVAMAKQMNAIVCIAEKEAVFAGMFIVRDHDIGGI